MACNLPSLVFDTPVNREILGDTGFYAEFGSSFDFAGKLEKLLGDSEFCKQSGKRSRQRAVAEHSWQQRGLKLQAVYRRLLGADQ
jgi:glycosyltransferase involved in cell wall biosynthesis